ncbi:hypothetical protein BN115_3076 [Bordetella bronchiseptica MO149]|uniref:HD-GYP domain-containing protein n=1 Tax=Bordetella bronchiseptica TaxID=518 RepID=UPI00028A592E|nr:HD domain-containing phosphohydrolase [Bordetella bronchiseptica]KDD15090.1 HD domain protein [Bordetella bronchiseptica MBORD707]QET71324.1 HD domain-containing protein [Bordetella bronchiseptica]RSB99435.1 HD domain-containing protein [Bordetella bronchiseptica]RSC08495.1 HD domain-containing protein [Bordetella bronchiseptica]CCJ59832.1 hypothetical protein BN115_3076 [Bordetella bronchiseptica MO149]
MQTESLPRSEADTRACRALAAALRARDPRTAIHSGRVAALAGELGRAYGLDGMAIRRLELGASLHDIGKLGVADRVLHHPGRLLGEDWTHMQEHSVLGERIIAATGLDDGAAIGRIVRHHHEHYDGSGYPDGLAGEAIPLEARLIALVDAYDAITAHRPYRPPVPHDRTMAMLEAEQGARTDPQAFTIFARMIERSQWRAG